MLEFWLFIALALQFYVSGTLALLLLKPRKIAKFEKIHIQYWGLAVWSIASTYFKNYMMPENDLAIVRSTLMMAGLIIYLYFCYEDPLRKKILIVGLYYLNAIFIEVVTLLLITVAFPWMVSDLNMHSPEGIFLYMIMIPFFWGIAFLEYLLSKGRIYITATKQTWPALIFPFFAYFQHTIQSSYFWANPTAALLQAIAMLLLSAVGVYWVSWLVLKNKSEEEAAELQSIHLTIAEQQIQYRKLQERSEEIAKLRHDYNNQLETIKALIETDPDQAGKMVEGLIEYLN